MESSHLLCQILTSPTQSNRVINFLLSLCKSIVNFLDGGKLLSCFPLDGGENFREQKARRGREEIMTHDSLIPRIIITFASEFTAPTKASSTLLNHQQRFSAAVVGVARRKERNLWRSDLSPPNEYFLFPGFPRLCFPSVHSNQTDKSFSSCASPLPYGSLLRGEARRGRE